MEPSLFVLDNPVQSYAWGSRKAIAQLQGRKVPSSTPEAELWIGAHPKAPSRIADPEGWGTLADAIRRFPDAMLGPAIAARFAGELPFLFKVLAAAEPLSIQAHPSIAQARAGFLRENRAGVPLDAPHRNYKDANHKPELVAPLTPFVALEGFRPADEIVAHFVALDAPLARLASASGPMALRAFFEALMAVEGVARTTLLDKARAVAMEQTGPAWAWVAKLQAKYPGDVGTLAPLYLNLVHLEPGEALYLPAGELHAYLEGTALEIMANSDNVLRGGLTPKHVDVAELVATLSFDSGRPEILRAVPTSPWERTYRTPAPEFELSLVETTSEDAVVLQGPCMLLCLEGEANLDSPGRSVPMVKGRTVFVPACVGSVSVSGQARLARAAVPSFG